MGLLEARTIDFDEVFVLSANEGHLPPATKKNSFIPIDVKLKFSIRTYLDDDAIWDLVRIVFINYKEKEICCIKIDKAPDPMFVKIHGSFNL